MLGKQFSTCKYKKYKLLSVTTGKLFEGYDLVMRGRHMFLSKFFHVYSTLSSNVGTYIGSKS